MSATVTQVAASTTTATACAADSGRDALYIYNASAVTCYVRIGGGTVTATTASFALAAGDTFEAPTSKATAKAYSVLLASGSGTVVVTEIS